MMICESTLYAEIHEWAGITSAQFLELGVGPRAVGMGESFCGVSDDVSTIYWNPAGLAQLTDMQIILMHNEWFQGIRSEFVGFSYPFEDELAAIGVGLTFLNIDNMLGRDEDGIQTHSFISNDRAIIVSGAKVIDWIPSLMIGCSVKFIKQSLEKEEADGIAYDIGFFYKTPINKLTLGFAVQNIGEGIKFVNEEDELPLNFKLGAAYKLLHDQILISCDLNQPSTDEFRVNTGLEWVVWEMIEFRAGYNSNSATDSGITAGVGLKLKRFNLDYAFVPYGILGNTQRVSVTGKIDVGLSPIESSR